MNLVEKGFIDEIKRNIQENSDSQEKLYHTLKQLFVNMIEADAFVVPVMPKVMAKLLNVINDEGVTFDHLSEIIKSDPLFTALLIKTANTSFYSTTFPITSVETAVKRIGLVEVKRLLVVISLSSFIVRNGKYGNFCKEFWEHSILTAIAAEELAKVRNINASGEYIAGLLHDIGKVFILMALMDIENTESLDLPAEMVQTLVDELHIQFGGYIADSWELPEYIFDSILYHRESSNVLDSTAPVLHVYLANIIAKQFNSTLEECLSVCISDNAYIFSGMKMTYLEEVIAALPNLFEKQKVAAGF